MLITYVKAFSVVVYGFLRGNFLVILNGNGLAKKVRNWYYNARRREEDEAYY